VDERRRVIDDLKPEKREELLKSRKLSSGTVKS
jgi:hypothetical protein